MSTTINRNIVKLLPAVIAVLVTSLLFVMVVRSTLARPEPARPVVSDEVLIDRVQERQEELHKAARQKVRKQSRVIETQRDQIETLKDKVKELQSRPATPAAVREVGTNGWAIPWYIVKCESGGNYRAENPISSASGAYQIIDGTWAAYGGLEFGVSHASHATPAQQDAVAARIWADVGASAWECA